MRELPPAVHPNDRVALAMLLEHGGSALGPEPWGTSRESWLRLEVAGLVVATWEPTIYRTPAGRNKKATKLDHYVATEIGRLFAVKIHALEKKRALERMATLPQRSGSLVRLKLRTRTKEIRNVEE